MPTSTAVFELSVSIGGNSFSASGKHDLVLKAFEDFKALTGGSVGDPTPTKPRGSKTKSNGGGASSPSTDGFPLPAYVKAIKLVGNKERATAILAWASENGKVRLTTREIEDLWKTTHFKVAGNLKRDLGLAAKEGWVAREGKGSDQAWVIHGFGKTTLASWGEPAADNKG
jgi:hypothetical protein